VTKPTIGIADCCARAILASKPTRAFHHHDHHRAVRTRRNASLPREPNASGQDRHIMIPSRLINDHCQTCFCRLPARHGRPRIHSLNSQAAALTNTASNQQWSHLHRLVHSPESEKISLHPSRNSHPQHRGRAQIPIAFLRHRPPAEPKAHYLSKRFRALALFGRRPAERVVRSPFRRPKTCTGADIVRCSNLDCALEASI
jgi:hypothetical protein